MGSKAAAVNFLKKLNFDASDSSDSSSSSSDEEQTKQQLVKKRRRPDSEDSGMEDKQPARRAPRKKKPVSDEEEEEKPARAARKKKPDVKDADGEEDAEMEKKKEKLAKRRIRDKARRDRVAEERRQLQVEDSDKMQEKEQDKLQEKEEEALNKKKEVAPKEREEKQLSRKAREDKSATKRKTKEERDAPRKKKEKVDEDTQRKDDEHKPTVTPSPSRKRARVSSSSSSASIGLNASSVVLTEDQKVKKALRKHRMDKLRNRREKQLEKKQAQRELHRALDKRDALLARKQTEKGAQDTVKKEKRKGKDTARENNDVDKMPKTRPLKKRRRTEDDAEVIKNEPNQVTPSADEAGKAHYTDKETDNIKDESPMSTSNDADSEPPLHNESAKEEKIEDAAKPPSPKDDPEDGEIHEEPPPPKEEKVVDKGNADESVANVKAENEDAGKAKDESAVLADIPIPKKSSSNSNALADLPIPRKARNPGEDPASFVIPKRPMSAGAGGNADGAEGAVHLSTSRMVRKPRAPLPDILKAVVNAAPSALVRPSRPRTKQVVPSELTKLDQAEKTFVITARKRRSLICASLSSEEFSRGPTPYEVFNADGSLMPDLTPRLMCPTLRDLSTNRDEYPSTYFGVGLVSPKVKVKTDREDSTDKSVSSVAVPGPLNCYEPLQFLRPEDRDSYQRKMYGTTFVPQLIKGHTTLIMRNAKYERKSRGIRFNADRDREDFQQVLSQRFKKNKSTPVCEIPRESWRKMMVDQRPGIVYLHFYNREDAMLAALEFVDDMGVPLEWKREYRAGIVLTANLNSTTPQSAPERSPSSERSFAPAASPNDSQYGNDRDRGRQSHRGRGRNWNGDQRGPPHRLQSHYGEQQVMQRSPAEPGDRGQRTSYMTPTGRNDRGREFDRPQHPSHSRSRSNPRSPSRSRSIHNPAADAPVDEKTASFAVNGDMSKQNDEESKGDALRPSQDNAKTVGGGDNGSIDSIKASDSNQGSHDGSVPTNMPSKDQDVYASSNQRHGAQTYPSNHDGRGGSHYGEYNSGSNNHEQWRGNDGRQRFGRRSRSRSRPRNQEPRRDWGRDDRGPHPPPDYDRRHSNGMYHDDGRGRGGYGGNDRYGPPPPPPPLPGDAPYHHDRRRY